jgi:PPOX class probable F420-dependent enzyme
MTDDHLRPAATIPPSHADLLERPLFAHLATVRPDGSPQNSVMWFDWDGSRVRMSHTRTRQKFANLTNEGRVSVSVVDPDDSYRYLEVRGVVESITPDDASAAFARRLHRRYGMEPRVDDADVRVVLTIRPTKFVATTAGRVAATSGR